MSALKADLFIFWAAGFEEPDRQHYGALIALGASKVTVMTRLMERLEVQIRSVTP